MKLIRDMLGHIEAQRSQEIQSLESMQRETNDTLRTALVLSLRCECVTYMRSLWSKICAIRKGRLSCCRITYLLLQGNGPEENAVASMERLVAGEKTKPRHAAIVVFSFLSASLALLSAALLSPFFYFLFLFYSNLSYFSYFPLLTAWMLLQLR